MNCRNCGKENQDGAAFCIGCGRELGAASSRSSGPAAVYTAPKKKNIAAIALGALSVLLAVALALSLTGVLGAASGAAVADSRSFGAPEDAINYFADRLAAGDYDGALGACAVNEMAQGFDYKAYVERMNAMPSITMTYMPSEYKQYVKYNRSKLEQQIMIQMACFTASFGLSDEYAGILQGQMLPLQDGKLPDGIIEQFDPSKLSGLKLLDIGKAPKHDDERNREMQKKQAKMYGADDIQFRTVLYEYGGKLYVGGFTAIEFGGSWMIMNMCDPLAGMDVLGTPIPVADKSAYEGMLE